MAFNAVRAVGVAKTAPAPDILEIAFVLQGFFYLIYQIAHVSCRTCGTSCQYDGEPNKTSCVCDETHGGDYCTLCQDNSLHFCDTDCVCLAGYKKSSSSCVPCGYGYYKDDIADTSCSSCPTGQTTLKNNATSSADCVCAESWGGNADDGGCFKCKGSTKEAGNGDCSCVDNSTRVNATYCQCDSGFHPSGYNFLFLPKQLKSKQNTQQNV